MLVFSEVSQGGFKEALVEASYWVTHRAFILPLDMREAVDYDLKHYQNSGEAPILRFIRNEIPPKHNKALFEEYRKHIDGEFLEEWKNMARKKLNDVEIFALGLEEE